MLIKAGSSRRFDAMEIFICYIANKQKIVFEISAAMFSVVAA
jgi:hypothetical protein